MENTNSQIELKEDRQMLMFLHLSQLLVITGIGGIIAPIIIWQLKKDDIQDMDAQGKEVVNFQISLFIYYAISGILSVVLIGIPLLIILGLLNLIFPIVYGIKANDGQRDIRYPLTIRLIK